jgi:hypothetical protein
LSAGAVTLALVPGRDPLHLPERGRMAYVYAAEALVALLFMHVRLTRPQWFGGMFMRYWPVVVMALAYGGVGLGEVFRRQKRLVLAQPLERSAAFLPLLPVLGFWALRSQVNYSALLVIVGLLYGALSVMRRSFGFGLLAALAGNGGLWYFLHHVDGLGLLTHPQLWLIPAALSVLAAAYLNRAALSDKQMQLIRYVCMMLIYLSSTTDMFINGVAQAPWLPVVLAGLSVAGVLAGMVLCVRSFLFLGTGFLLLSLVTIIYHASVDLHQTWLIWVSGIALGLAILFFFALFEKKRNEIVAVVGKLREWEG